MSRQLQTQLELEAAAERSAYLTAELKKVAKQLVNRLKKLGKTSAFRTKSAGTASKKALETVQEYFDDRSRRAGAEVNTFLSLSQNDAQAVSEILCQAETLAGPRVEQLCRGLEHDFHELERVRRALERIPGDDVTGPIVERIQRLHERLGGLREKRAKLADDRSAVELQSTDVERRRRRLAEELGQQEQIVKKLEHVRRVRSALEDYLQQLTARKIDDLRRTVADCINRLAHKGDVVREIDIDSRTFQVTLYGQEGTAIPKAELSSGEKQIYAIAMLWALARTSGRPLPMIIDTPLARLDSDHRRNLCRNYFPHASHQVIILSTDTEVDQGLFKQLSPNISHSVHLQYDGSQGSTSASEGYSWRLREVAHV